MGGGRKERMTIKKTGNRYGAPILYKAFTILKEISLFQSQLGVSEIARKLDISKSTVYGITQALTDLEVLRQDPDSKKFWLGPALVQLGNRAMDGIDLRLLARPLMEELSKEFRETVFLGNFDAQRITIIEKAESPVEFKITAPIGTRITKFAGAAGKVFLAGLDDHQLEAILAGDTIPNFTAKSITDVNSYRQEINLVRKMGFATDFGEYIQGINAICTPITNLTGRTVAALWMVGFAHAFTQEKMRRAIPALMRATFKIYGQFGISTSD